MLFPAPQLTTTAAKSEAISPSETTVTAYPNPHTDKVNFTVNSKVSGYGSLEVLT